MKPISSDRGMGFFVDEVIMRQDNRRKYQRASMMGRLRLMQPDDQFITEAYVDNVGLGGMGLYSLKPVEANCEVVLKIFYMDGSGEKAPEIISGVVRWCRPIGTWFGVGVEFKPLDPEKHSMLLNFLEQTEQPQLVD
jgi:hypothetical protein